MQGETSVVTKINSGIGTIEFGTPKSNSLPGHVLRKLAEEIIQTSENPDVKVILIRSTGEKAFCAGASFDELLEIDDLESSKIFFSGFAEVLEAMRTCGKLVVVRVQGKTTGGGVGIACGADYCFATQNASFALTELNLGIGPFVIGPYVERKMGTSQFTAMAMDASFRDAQWGKNHGVYHEVYQSIDEMDSALDAFINQLANRSTKALSLIKKVSWENTDHFSDLMPERITMSASLILEPYAKKQILSIKEKLAAKN